MADEILCENYPLKNWLLSSIETGLSDILKDNVLAQNLRDVVAGGDFKLRSRKELATLIVAGRPTKPDGDRCNTESDTFRDLRLCDLALQNVKKYPGKENDVYYGLSFCRAGHPVSSVFLGSNGVGKTSLYAALEYVGMRHMNTALIRGLHREIGQSPDVTGKLEDSQSDFLAHSALADIKIRVNTVSGFISVEDLKEVQKPYPRLVTDSFYCSEYDVRYLEKCTDFSGFLLDQLGLGDFAECLQLLYYTGRYIAHTWSDYNFRINAGATEINKFKLTRLLTGIWSGLSIVDFNKFKGFILPEFSKNALEPLSPQELKDFVAKYKNLVEEEMTFFSASNWYTQVVRQSYADAIRYVESIMHQLVEDPDISQDKLEPSLVPIYRFHAFHQLLKEAVEEYVNMSKDYEEGIPWDKRNERIEVISSEGLERQKVVMTYEKVREDFLEMMSQYEDYDDLLKQYYELTAYIENALEEKLKRWMEDISESIKTLLNNYFAIDNDKLDIEHGFEKLKNEENLETLQVGENAGDDNRRFFKYIIKIKSSHGNLELKEPQDPVLPRNYLNTFKYKLFCVAFKMALCCVSKSIYKINFPFVVDDVFDASDFESRLKLRDFIKELFNLHNKLLKNPEYKLQLIFFTQDDLIADQVEQGIMWVDGKTGVLFGHIFDYHEMQSDISNEVRVVIGKKHPFAEMSYINLADRIDKIYAGIGYYRESNSK